MWQWIVFWSCSEQNESMCNYIVTQQPPVGTRLHRAQSSHNIDIENLVSSYQEGVQKFVYTILTFHSISIPFHSIL